MNEAKNLKITDFARLWSSLFTLRSRVSPMRFDYQRVCFGCRSSHVGAIASVTAVTEMFLTHLTPCEPNDGRTCKLRQETSPVYVFFIAIVCLQLHKHAKILTHDQPLFLHIVPDFVGFSHIELAL